MECLGQEPIDPDEERISIGKMAELNGISIRMLRFYHEKGLLVPSCVGQQTGYRSYTLAQCNTLDMIQQMQSLDIPLEQIKTILERHDVDYVAEVLKGRLASIEELSRKLETEKRVCTALIEDYRIYQNKPICDEPMLENLPRRRIMKFPHEGGEAYARGITTAEAKADLERMLRIIKKEIIEQGYSLALFRNVGCIIPFEHLARREYVFSYSYVFVYDSDDVPDASCEYFPAGQYMTMYSDGIIRPDGSYKAVDNVERLLDYIDARGMEPAGDYMDEVIVETPPFLEDRWNMLYKLYIPVRQRQR